MGIEATILEAGIIGGLVLVIRELIGLAAKLVTKRQPAAQEAAVPDPDRRHLRQEDLDRLRDTDQRTKRMERAQADTVKHLNTTSRHLNDISLQLKTHVATDDKFQNLVLRLGDTTLNRLHDLHTVMSDLQKEK